MLTSPFSWGSGNSGWILYNIPFEVDCLVRNLNFFFLGRKHTENDRCSRHHQAKQSDT